MDFSMYEKECRSMGGLFQQLAHEMKSSSSVWQDFTVKANKLYSSLWSTTATMTSFIDSLQRVADMANNSKGAVKDIGATLTRLCLRQRSIEDKLKEFVLILGGTFSPIPGLLDDWKKTVVQMDHAHTKEYKKLNNEIQKNLTEATKLKKQVDKGGNAAKLQPSLDSKIQSVEFKYSDLATNENVALKKLTLHERQRFSFFVKCLKPLLEKECELLTEVTHLDEVTRVLSDQTKDSESIIRYCEDFVDDFRCTDTEQQEIPFVTPPGTPHGLSRHSSSISIRSSSSSLSQLRRPHSTIGHQQFQQQKQKTTDGNSELSVSMKTPPPSLVSAIDGMSINSQNTLTRKHSETNNNYTSADYNATLTRTPASSSPPPPPPQPASAPADYSNNSKSNSSTNLTTFFTNRTQSFSNNNDNHASLKRSTSKLTNNNNNNNNHNNHNNHNHQHNNKNDVEDSELMLAHREESDHCKPFQRSTATRSTISIPNKTSPTNDAPNTALQSLDSPIRPGRQNDKRRTLDQSKRATTGDYYKNESGGHYNAGNSSFGYATLGRNNSAKKGFFSSARASFFGSHVSTGRINHPTSPNLTSSSSTFLGHNYSPPPPPPPPPFVPPPPPPPDEQIATLLKGGAKKTSAPLPPGQQSQQQPQQQSQRQQPQSPQQLQQQPQQQPKSSQQQQLTTSLPPQRPPSLPYSPQNSVFKQKQQNSINVIKSSTTTAPERPKYPPQPSLFNRNYQPITIASDNVQQLPPKSPPVKSESENNKVIPIRILHKYADGLAAGKSPENQNRSPFSLADSKPFPPTRLSSFSQQEEQQKQQQQQQQQQQQEQLNRSFSLRQQGPPSDSATVKSPEPITFN